MSEDQIAGRIIAEWDSAMDEFYNGVYAAMTKYGWERSEVERIMKMWIPEAWDGWDEWYEAGDD